MTAALSPLFSWRGAIASKESELSPTVRHVALTLSLHMSERGDSCFPAVPTLAEETGLADSTVRESLKTLCTEGWLVKEERYRGDGSRSSNAYTATVPERLTPHRLPVDPPVLPVDPPPATGGPPSSDGGRSEDVSESASESVSKDTPPTPRKRGEDDGFDGWWTAYTAAFGAGRAGSKGAAHKTWAKLTKAERTEAGVAVERHHQCLVDSPDGYGVPHAVTWLNQRRWMDETLVEKPTSSATPRKLSAAEAALERWALQRKLPFIEVAAR